LTTGDQVVTMLLHGGNNKAQDSLAMDWAEVFQRRRILCPAAVKAARRLTREDFMAEYLAPRVSPRWPAQ
jgi:hypothetical protein